jgi:hypothetical protein
MSNQNANQLNLKSPSDFTAYLDSLSKISESAIVTVDREKMSSLVASTDNTLILYAEYGVESSLFSTLNIPDVKKLTRVLDTIDNEEIDLNINSNNIEYKGNGVKFKYHLFDEGFLTKPSLNIDKINAFTFDMGFKVDKNILNQIFKGSVFASETNKLYFYTEENRGGEGFRLMAELTDRARHNTDNFTLCIGLVKEELSPIPINFDNVRLLNNISGEFIVRINKEYGVVVFEQQADDISLKYIVSSLTQ